MARNLRKGTESNSITLHDPVGQADVVFYYRDLTSKDRIRHLTAKFGRTGDGKLVNRHYSACIESATEVLTGIRTGDFNYGDGPLSSTQGEDGYREDWKELLVEMAGDLLFLVGNDLFEPRIAPQLLQGVEIVGEFDAPAAMAEEEEPPPLGGAPEA